jgi:hypothetical protein
MEEKKLEIKKRRLFVIKAKESTGKGFELYLNNRDWEVVSMTELKKALVTILSQPFEVAMVSMDHPNPKCFKLPAIIAQTVRVPVILFAEGTSQVGINALRNSKHPYILYPPVSGPAIERMILKIKKDQAGVKSGFDPLDAANHDRITISSSGGDNDINEVKGRSNYSMEDVVRLFEGDGTLGGHTDQGDAIQLRSHGTEEGKEIRHGNSGSPSEPSGNDASSRASAGGNQFDPTSNFGTGLGRTKDPPFGTTQKGDRERNVDPDQNTDSANGFNNGVGMAARNSRATETALNNGRTFDSKHEGPAMPLSLEDAESMLIRGVEHALHKTAVKDPALGRSSRTVSRCARVSCFELRTNHFNGYLVVAFGADREVDEAFNENLKTNLVTYLTENNIQVDTDEFLDLKLTEACFEAWSLKEAAFLRKAIHHDNDIALAFFPYKDERAPLELAKDSKMFKLSLTELRIDALLEFDIYLYLPANQKFVRYVAKSRKLEIPQRTRLISGGVHEVHVRKEAEKDIIRYRVQNFLNDKIRSYSEADIA